jgi:hypothetical protein
MRCCRRSRPCATPDVEPRSSCDNCSPSVASKSCGKLLDINSVVVQMQPLVRGLLESDIEVVLEFADSMKLIPADRSQLEQAS